MDTQAQGLCWAQLTPGQGWAQGLCQAQLTPGQGCTGTQLCQAQLTPGQGCTGTRALSGSGDTDSTQLSPSQWTVAGEGGPACPSVKDFTHAEFITGLGFYDLSLSQQEAQACLRECVIFTQEFYFSKQAEDEQHQA